MEAQLRVEEGAGAGAVHALRPGRPRTLGRRPAADLPLDDPAVAPRHAAVKLEGGRLLVVDLGSGAGTFLNDAPLPPHAPREAWDGDALRLGGQVLRVELTGDDGRPCPRPASAVEAGVPDDFEVLRPLGRGAAGVVLAARRRADGRPVALKLLAEPVAPGSPEHERFLREGRLAAGLRSPHVVEVLDAQVTPAGAALIVMELVEGPSLEAVLRARGALPVPEALRVAAHVAAALAVTAAAGIVHRDVKPANVLLAPGGAAKLTDFGVARSLTPGGRSLTRTGQGLGTMAYMAPEQVWDAKRVDPRADLYGLGATLYHMLAGRPPFDPRSVEDLERTLAAPPPPLAAARPDCPPAVADLVHGLLQKDPFDRRPPSARALGQALRALME